MNNIITTPIIKRTLKLLLALFLVNFYALSIQAKTPEKYTWQQIETIDFGTGANHFTIQAASVGLGGELELRLDAADEPVIGRVFFHRTGGLEYFLPYECDLTQKVSGVHEVYMNFQDYADPILGRKLAIGDYSVTLNEAPSVEEGDSLHIYPPVPGLDPSPYYDIYIQKVSALNSANLTAVTNWETPFAWFTQCPDNVGDTKGYYSSYIGGWSHTYTNFEMDNNTPIVVKIVRKEDTGDDAPSGPINSAMLRPAHSVDSWEIIDGELYVTMSDPALVAVDIDGQMETRVAPRATPTEWNSTAFPFNNRKDGAHSVTIFANPFIKDKPNPDDPGVLLVKAGEKIPSTAELENQDWDILYFEPGIHRTSVDVDGQGNLVERKWQADDPITFQDNKTYYVPGDAIVYGNFTDINRSNKQSVNIRIYGHGTVSGSKINHNKVDGEADSNEGWWNRALYLRDAKNCHFEGITAVDPAFHTLCIGSTVKSNYDPNTIKWTKVLAWRTNSDGTSVGGHVEMEDCFIRCQDDGHYIGGTTRMSRVVFWHDVNGQTFRSDFSNRRYSQANAANIPDVILYEDIDVIYARGVFTTSDNGFGIIGLGADRGSDNETLRGGVENTGQMYLFRNIRITDPHPTRNLFSFGSEVKKGDFAGFRFEDIDYQGEQVFGWRNKLKGIGNSFIRNFVFDNVTISGEKMDKKMVRTDFITGNLADLTFRKDHQIASTDYILTTTITNGTITSEETDNPGEVTLSVAVAEGYEFNGWSGDLTGTENPVTLTIDRNMAITASVDLFKYDINTTSENGSIILDPEDGSYLPGSVVRVTTESDLGFGFNSWGGDLSGSEKTVTLTMDGDKNITANFSKIVTYNLDIDTKYGTVVLDPPGGVYNSGSQVSLTANPDMGYLFDQWLGDLSGSQSTKTITMDGDKTVNARFLYVGAGSSSGIALNCGGSQYTSADNVVYQASSEGASYSTNAPIAGTEDDKLYQSETWSSSLSYNFELANGLYELTLKFAEIYHSTVGKRVFDVLIEGETVLSNFDILAEAGGKDIALDKTFIVTLLDGELNIAFNVLENNPKISAIQLRPLPIEVEDFALTSSAINGSINIDPNKESYPAGSLVNLEAVPASGYAFIGWTGDFISFDNPTELYMDGNKTVSALFDTPQNYTLTCNVNNGQISISPEKASYNQLEKVEISVTPDEGYKFVGWQGDLSGSENPTILYMNSNKEISAEIVKIPSYSLVAAGEKGTVSINPAKETYMEGEQVSITAIADEGYRFTGWSGDLAGSQNPVTLTLNADKNITAEFELIPIYTLTTSANNGSIILDPVGGSYQEATKVTVSFTADEGYRFVGWQGDLSGSQNPVTITMTDNKEIGAQTEEIPTFTLSTEGVNGSVSIDPEKESYFEGDEVTITATADEGYIFRAWSGDLSGSMNPVSFTMDADKSITANFDIIPVYTLTTMATNGSISLDPEAESYELGTSVTLSLTVDEGYEFVGWLGDLTGNENPATIVMDQNKTITAAIVEIPSYSLTVNAENGSVVLDPAGGSYEEGTEVEVTAVPDDGFSFKQWSGNLSGTLNPETIVIDGNKSITAEFDNDTDVKEFGNGALMQSYPNPFSDKTTIEYHLSSPEHVKISIYNMTGQEVVVLVDREKRSGKHEVIWDAQQSYGKAVPQGLYICRFEAGGIVQTTKVILAK